MLVQVEDLKEVLGIDLTDTTEDHYLMNLIRRATSKLCSLCNRNLEYGVNIEYYSMAERDRLYLNNWPVWEVLEIQEFNPSTNIYENIFNQPGDTISNSLYFFESKNNGQIRLMKNYSFSCYDDKFNVRVKYKSGYKNLLGTGKITGYDMTIDVSGNGTIFNDEISSGDRIVVDNYEYTISGVISNTNLNVTSNIETTFKDHTFRINNVPGDLTDAVLTLSASSYLVKKYESYGMDQKTLSFLSMSDKEIQDMIGDSRTIVGVRMRFKDFDLGGVVDAYRRVNV